MPDEMAEFLETNQYQADGEEVVADLDEDIEEDDDE
jgi:hypothetical protein